MTLRLRVNAVSYFGVYMVHLEPSLASKTKTHIFDWYSAPALGHVDTVCGGRTLFSSTTGTGAGTLSSFRTTPADQVDLTNVRMIFTTYFHIRFSLPR